MLAQPIGGLYVTYGDLAYYRDLARKRGREDLILASWVDFSDGGGHRWRGKPLTGIYIDHAVFECLSADTYDRVCAAVQRLKPQIRS